MADWMWPFLVALFTFCLGVGASIVVFAFTLYSKFSDRISKLEGDMRESKTQMIPLSALIQEQLLRALHHDEPRFKECDGLIDQYNNLTITKIGQKRLDELLKERETDMTVTDKERKQAKARRALMEVIVIEIAEKKTMMDKMVNSILPVLFFMSSTLAHAVRHWR